MGLGEGAWTWCWDGVGGLWGWCCNGTRGFWGWEWDGASYGMRLGVLQLVIGLAQWGLDPGRTEAGGRGGTFLAASAHPCKTGAQQAAPPSAPCPFCAPSPKALSSLPSSLHGDPGAFPVSPVAVGPFRGNSHGPLKGLATAGDSGRALVALGPLAPFLSPAVPPSSQHEGDLPGALTAQQVEEQSAAPCCQHAEAGEPPCRSRAPHLQCHIHLPPHARGCGQPMGDTQ